MESYNNFSICFIDVTKYIKRYSFWNQDYSVETYYRFLIPYIFTEYKKVIYLDCDIICLTDIAGILTNNSTDAMIECSRDIGFLKRNANASKHSVDLGLKTASNYFNAGVIVFNIAVFSSVISQDELFSKTGLKNIKYLDQDILNIVCEDRVYFLDMSWNVMADDGKYRHANIIHYVWDKPWKQFFITERNKHFWLYTRRTPFVDIIYSELKESSIET
jgi:lipopolysaccharide biosynthesis glycosyltransferase